VLFVLTLVNDETPYAELEQNVMRQCSGAYRVVPVRGASSMATGYNNLVRSLVTAPDDVLCFIHQDARLLFDAAVILPQYLERLRWAGVLGFCGSAAQQPGKQWHQCLPCYGSYLQGRGPGRALSFRPPGNDTGGLLCAEVQTLDGYCLFVSRQVFDRIGGFDEEYGGWHCYDLDLCLRALHAGYQNYVIAQPSQHYSWGGSDQDLARSLALFSRKWSAFLSADQWDTWVELSDACRLRGDHADSYRAAKMALAIHQPAPRHRGQSVDRSWKPHDLLSIAAWYLGFKEESLEHALQALARNPLDDRLINNYRLVQQLAADGQVADGPPRVDVVILSYAKTEREYEMTKGGICSLRLSSPDVPVHVVVVETNAQLRAEPFTKTDDELFGPRVDVVYPGGKFAYNAFLQVGYEACAGSPAQYFMVLNNDVILFGSGFLRQMLAGLESVPSVSPQGMREALWGLIDVSVSVDVNYDINRALCGWCLMFDKRILASAPFEAYFPRDYLWYGQDEHYAATLQAHGHRHGLVTRALALHLQSSSQHLLGETLAAPASRVDMLRAIGIRHKRCAAVGVARGAFAREILALDPARLVLVDQWQQDADGHHDRNGSDAECEAWYQEVKRGIGRSDRVEIIRSSCVAAAAQVADRCLDFVYLDVLHSEEAVGMGVRAWWRTVKPGGWVTGHHYQVGAVQRAVAAVCAEQRVSLAFVTRDENPTWAIQVPR
jgi:GT2 family glycosyltransferase